MNIPVIAKVHSAAIVGLDAVPIEVEVDIASQGLPSFTIVGLPDKAVEESRERVRAALKNAGCDFPAKRITVNLAPADIPKEGPSYDLPIAVGILIASSQIPPPPSSALFCGELSLDGSVRATSGILPQALMARERHIAQFYLPLANAKEAACIEGIDIYALSHIKALCLHLSQTTVISPFGHTPIRTTVHADDSCDIAHIKGQEHAKRAMEIAAAGGHNLMFKGPPGSGKTLLARSLPTLLPEMTFSEVLEVTKIYSIAGLLGEEGLKTIRPFRSPHHSTSPVGLIGGGTYPRPGEVSLAHRGVLFLDELPEFPRNVLESLRQPLEDGIVSISRASGRISFPAKTMFVAAMNPCPCGFLGDPTHECTCAPSRIISYQKKISGPLLDRIDLHLEVPAVEIDKLTATKRESAAESSASIRLRVQKARDIQTARFAGTSLTTNADMSSRDIDLFCALDHACTQLLRQAVEKFRLSARAYHRLIKLSRTIADLGGEIILAPSHIAEALQYRPRETH